MTVLFPIEDPPDTCSVLTAQVEDLEME